MVYNGEDALKIAADFRPEAIFCDIGMAGIDGTEVAARLREDARFATTVLVAITGWGAEEDIRRTQRIGLRFSPDQTGQLGERAAHPGADLIAARCPASGNPADVHVRR